MSRRGGGYGGTGTMDGTLNSAELPGYDWESSSLGANTSDALGQDPSVLLSGLNPIEIASSGVDFSGVDLSGIDLNAIGIDQTMLNSFDSTVSGLGGFDVADSIPIDSIGDAMGGADVVTEAGSGFFDSIADILGSLF